ncbi:hypothetical protein FBEOM_13231 [Fusarium beomiforme]|uniref:Nucleoside phosphorylase domain-containing protein n=1 Tax=Fusarium beomiforme TaxID=44412 RepID=A0A9P5A6Q4_9HYPO|nr:hypothetical protein FBEOM_13231 [Fusarium beomiforme]
MASIQPQDRDGFRVAIICALPREADAVTLLFDEFWDETSDPYGRADSDTNIYITGRIGQHNVVLAVLPGMGTNNATATAVNLRTSYRGLKLALIVGVCGGLPRIAGSDAFLGDVVVSRSVFQYDYTLEEITKGANKDLRTLLAVGETEFMRARLRKTAARYLKHLQQAAKKEKRRARYHYPGAEKDILYSPEYSHKHRHSCSVCTSDSYVFCEGAAKAPCTEVGCEPTKVLRREREEYLPEGADFIPEIFIGCVGSGNSVIESGLDRDQIAARHHLIAFEMEGAGVWDEIPTIVIKGICDYADSHKNKAWQDFAAATAASVAKAILGRYPASNVQQPLAPQNGMLLASSCGMKLTKDRATRYK